MVRRVILPLLVLRPKSCATFLEHSRVVLNETLHLSRR
jgi:hypothetical protein